jgi:ornithine carbamoyltransferase
MEGVAAPSDERLHETLHGRDLLSVRDATGPELASLIALASDIKRHPHRYGGALAGRTVAMQFEKPSLRTRVSFAVAAYQLGAQAISLAPQEVGLERRETIEDVARTLDQMVDAIVVRTFSHTTVEQLADAASIPP